MEQPVYDSDLLNFRFVAFDERMVAAISPIHKLHCFEEFIGLINRGIYLFISGYNARQNELIVKLYMNEEGLIIPIYGNTGYF